MLIAGLGAAAPGLYLVSGVLIAGLLVLVAPAHYLMFVIQIWFFSPLVRRVSDYQTDWHPQSIVMLTPIAVTLVGVARGLLVLGRSQRAQSGAFLLMAAGLLYGFGVGLGRSGFVSPVYDLLEWAVPLAFAYYILKSELPGTEVRRTVCRALVISVALTGAYGVVQFFSPPPWDLFWMQHAPIRSIGTPEARQFRAFGTLNSPTPFAIAIMAGLLLLPACAGSFGVLYAIPAGAALLLSLVRSAWGGYILGVLLTAIILRHRTPETNRRGVLIALALTCACLLYCTPGVEALWRRFRSFTVLHEDHSFVARVNWHSTFGAEAVSNPVGAGLGTTGTAAKLWTGDSAGGSVYSAFDSGLLNVPFVLGWPGTLLYLAGLFPVFRTVLRNMLSREDVTGVAGAAAVVAIASQMLFINVLRGVLGMLLWSLIAVVLVESRRARERPEES